MRCYVVCKKVEKLRRTAKTGDMNASPWYRGTVKIAPTICVSTRLTFECAKLDVHCIILTEMTSWDWSCVIHGALGHGVVWVS